jgi:hypothetical protein
MKKVFILLLVSFLSLSFVKVQTYAQEVESCPYASEELWSFDDFAFGNYAVDNHDGTVTSHTILVGKMSPEDEFPAYYEVLGWENETISLEEFNASYAQHYVLYASWSAAVSAEIARIESLPPRIINDEQSDESWSPWMGEWIW